MNSCRITFKTSPISIGIPFKMIKYPKPYNVLLPPPVSMGDELASKLMTGNIRPESSRTKIGQCVNCHFV